MSKGEFVGGLQVRRVGSTQAMELSGTADDWIGLWTENGQSRSQHFKPEELERVPVVGGP